jgi:Fur-regulated basic protein A
MELMRHVLIQKLYRLNVYESSDGRLLKKLSLDELQLEYSRALDRLDEHEKEVVIR